LPELVVGVQATLQGKSEITVGNVIGSNIANILLILALAALIAPILRPARVLTPDGYVLFAVTSGVLLLGAQGKILGWQGFVLIAFLIGLLTWQFEPLETFSEDVPVRLRIALLLTFVGLGLLPFGASMLIDGASQAARALGVSDAVIGITIVAIGTSLPELASAGAAAWRGHSDFAYGNVIGSNLFNILGILGASAIAAPLTVPREILTVDGPLLLFSTLLMVYFLVSGERLVRWEAAVMLTIYVAYIFLRLVIVV
jgi:cation:H+ antiporter